jgi:hypothetical protein
MDTNNIAIRFFILPSISFNRYLDRAGGSEGIRLQKQNRRESKQNALDSEPLIMRTLGNVRFIPNAGRNKLAFRTGSNR